MDFWWVAEIRGSAPSGRWRNQVSDVSLFRKDCVNVWVIFIKSYFLQLFPHCIVQSTVTHTGWPSQDRLLFLLCNVLGHTCQVLLFLCSWDFCMDRKLGRKQGWRWTHVCNSLNRVGTHSPTNKGLSSLWLYTTEHCLSFNPTATTIDRIFLSSHIIVCTLVESYH